MRLIPTDRDKSDDPPPTPPQDARKAFWLVFSSTFVTIFLAEIGDKTQIATLLMSAQSQSPWIVFAGAAIALIATSMIGVSLGQWLARRLTPKALEVAIATLLLVVSTLLLGDAVSVSP